MSKVCEQLAAYTDAARHMDIQGAAIDMLETLQSTGSRRAVAALLKDQQVQLRKMDKAAESLGAPYLGKTGSTP